MESVAIEITIPSEDQSKPHYDIWNECEKAVHKVVEHRIGPIPFTTNILYSDYITGREGKANNIYPVTRIFDGKTTDLDLNTVVEIRRHDSWTCKGKP